MEISLNCFLHFVRVDLEVNKEKMVQTKTIAFMYPPNNFQKSICAKLFSEKKLISFIKQAS